MLLCRHLPQGFLLPEVGNAVGPKGNDGDGHSVVLPSWMEDRAASRPRAVSYFTITQRWLKGEDPFPASPTPGSGSLSPTMSLKTSEDNLKNMRPFANQGKNNHTRRCNGLKCRRHYGQGLVLNERSEQLRLQSSFSVAALFANSYRCALYALTPKAGSG